MITVLVLPVILVCLPMILRNTIWDTTVVSQTLYSCLFEVRGSILRTLKRSLV
ncbi:hypothetical protein O6H91_08G053200 [Diphasiastrum complanatum]|uniref:Uncharacterized protein n=1 Tax=Diphasiastrum complanatum TaxID=34168 RepID=A0ACC2CXY4_DIPCM|nr:hypothetical protein O6H91_08G053200 [Diphasiastrum complanatum]